MTRFPVVRDATRLKVIHRQRVLRQGDADPPPAFSLESIDPELRPRAVEGWTRLLETEHESVVIAGWMASALARVGAPLDVIGAFGRVVEDEIRHVDIAAEMVERLGGQPSLPVGELPPFPIHVATGAAARESEYELMAGLIGFFCVFEHLSAHVFRQSLEVVQVDLARWALSEIHRDEAFHGAFGFETAKVFLPKFDDTRRNRIADHVASEVARFEKRLGGPLPKGKPVKSKASLEKLGLLDTPELLATFYEAVATELKPRMEELGVLVRFDVRPLRMV